MQKKEQKVYQVRCPECGPKGQALVSGYALPDYFCQFVVGCFCEFTAVKLEPYKQSKAAREKAAFLERCLNA
jgi:hypothetical protein